MLHLQLIKPKCQLFFSNLNLPPKLILCPNKVWWNKITVTGKFSVHTESRILHKFAFFQLADAFIQITFNENNTSGNNNLKKSIYASHSENTILLQKSFKFLNIAMDFSVQVNVLNELEYWVTVNVKVSESDLVLHCNWTTRLHSFTDHRGWERA